MSSTTKTCLPSMALVKERLGKQVYRKHTCSILFAKQQIECSPLQVLFLLSQIVFILGPITVDHLKSLVGPGSGAGHIFSRKRSDEVLFLLSLSVALKLISRCELGEKSYYHCTDYTLLKKYLPDRSYGYVQKQRARMLSCLLKIESFNRIYADVKGQGS